jgi:signal transduction histidine kinase
VHSAYIQSPDRAYQISAEIEIPRQAGISPLYLYDTIQKAKEINADLESVHLYDAAGNLVMNPADPLNTTVDTLPPAIMDQIRTGSDMEVTEADSNIVTRYLYIESDSNADPAAGIRIVEVTYNLQKQADEIRNALLFNFTTGMLAIVFGAVVTFTFCWYITRPVDAIVEDVGVIARGDLDHTIRETKGLEFARLEESINLMVGRLKETIERLRESEDQVRQYSENLEEMVARRTEQLKFANEEANLYIDILLHDINNANTVTLAYLEFLKESNLSDEQRDYAGKALDGAQKSVEIIRNVGTIRKTYEKKTHLVPISLDRVIREEIAHHPGATIRYGGTDAVVIADTLLGEVFANLIGNSGKHGGSGAEIGIAVVDLGDEVEVSVEDNGPGIPDDLKDMVFERSSRGKSRAPGTGLGLHICRSLVTWYGGTIRADDRVAGRPGEGAAIRFTLRKFEKED